MPDKTFFGPLQELAAQQQGPTATPLIPGGAEVANACREWHCLTPPQASYTTICKHCGSPVQVVDGATVGYRYGTPTPCPRTADGQHQATCNPATAVCGGRDSCPYAVCCDCTTDGAGCETCKHTGHALDADGFPILQTDDLRLDRYLRRIGMGSLACDTCMASPDWLNHDQPCPEVQGARHRWVDVL